MLLETGFFTIVKQEAEADKLNVVLQINPKHEIFDGHFPHLPIVPGVCMLQMVREIVERHLNRKLLVGEVKNMKFLSPYNPLEQGNSNLTISLSNVEHSPKITANLSGGNVTFFKMTAHFYEAQDNSEIVS